MPKNLEQSLAALESMGEFNVSALDTVLTATALGKLHEEKQARKKKTDTPAPGKK